MSNAAQDFAVAGPRRPPHPAPVGGQPPQPRGADRRSDPTSRIGGATVSITRSALTLTGLWSARHAAPIRAARRADLPAGRVVGVDPATPLNCANSLRATSTCHSQINGSRHPRRVVLDLFCTYSQGVTGDAAGCGPDRPGSNDPRSCFFGSRRARSAPIGRARAPSSGRLDARSGPDEGRRAYSRARSERYSLWCTTKCRDGLRSRGSETRSDQSADRAWRAEMA